TGVTGFKPTYGRLSRYGLIAMASSLDCPGPFARSAEDAQLLAHIMSGRDPLDATTLPAEKIHHGGVGSDQQPLKGKVIGLPKEYFAEGLDAIVGSRVREALQ